MVSVGLASGKDVVSLHTGRFMVANILTPWILVLGDLFFHQRSTNLELEVLFFSTNRNGC